MADVSKSEKVNSLLRNVTDILGSDSSVELSQTSKGVPTWKIKCYNGNPEDALAMASKLFDACKEKYGQGDIQ